MTAIDLSIILFTSTTQFRIGLFGVLTQKSAIRILISIEILLNSANINFVAFSSFSEGYDGWIMALFVMSLAAAEAAIGIAIFLNVLAKALARPVQPGFVIGVHFPLVPLRLIEAFTF